MSKESLHHEDITENMYIDPGAETNEAYEISQRSRSLAREMIKGRDPESRIRQRSSVAVGDFAMADLILFCNDPVTATLEALDYSATIITDIRMVQIGIQKKGHTCDLICALDHGSEIAHSQGITRTSAGFLDLQEKIPGSIVVIGNAPSALLTLCDLIKRGISPSVVIGTPVGFVNAAESKALLTTLSVPSISTIGTRGGTPVAVAALNECITVKIERDGYERPGHRV